MNVDRTISIGTPILFIVQIDLTLYFLSEGPQIGALASGTLAIVLGYLSYLQVRRYFQQRSPKV